MTEFQSPTLQTFLASLPFVQEYGIELTSASRGEVEVTMPFAARFSTPPGLFPASLIGTVGDVAAISACVSALEPGWTVATFDFTVKVTNPARGKYLRARGRVLQQGRTLSTAQADIWSVSGEDELHCGILLATGRNFRTDAQ